MKKQWKELLVALLLGLLAPRLMLGIGSKGAAQPTQQSTQPPTQAQTETAPPAQQLITVLTADGSLLQMPLEEYVLGVVLAEMPAEFEKEALKAQAVVARTYALRRAILRDRHPDGAVCTSSACCQAHLTRQAYLDTYGDEADIDKISQAVVDTHGLVLHYQNELAEATYFSCSGGRTEDAAAVWGEDIPYLQAVDSPGEEHAENHTATLFFTADRFQQLLGRALQGSPENWLGQMQYTTGGGVSLAFIGGIGYGGTLLREKLGLNSTAFTLRAEDGGIAVTTRGKGHRVGMSQYGADAMALSGSSYSQILSHYYPGTRIDKMPPLG